MIAKGFEDTVKKIDLENLEKDMNLQFNEVNEQLEKITNRLSSITWS
jgi:hypothetical protein